MSTREYVIGLCTDAAASRSSLADSSVAKRNEILSTIAKKLACDTCVKEVLAANELDIKAARENGMSEAMVDRLTLSEARLNAMIGSLNKLIALPDVLGEGECFTRPNGLKIKRVSVPLGTIGIIYESRPNVTVDAAAICIKTGNAAILRGGKEAINSNKALSHLIKDSLTQCGADGNCIQLIEDTSRESSLALMEARGYIDVLIPRGGKGLIRSVCENARVPVIETGAGNCHVYVEKTAPLDMALRIVLNAKLQRPSVCNAAESLLVDSQIAPTFLPMLYEASREKSLIFKGDDEVKKMIPEALDATEDDYYAEYNDYIMSVNIVSGVDEAISRINHYSTHHSEAIVTNDIAAADRFTALVDSAAVYVNASTRFTDGEEFGFGAEIGISTQKLHARGPMGPKQLTTYKYVIEGNGQIR